MLIIIITIKSYKYAIIEKCLPRNLGYLFPFLMPSNKSLTEVRIPETYARLRITTLTTRIISVVNKLKPDENAVPE